MAGEAVGLVTGAPTIGAPSCARGPELFPIWAMPLRPYFVRREYLTEVIVSRGGNEQRRALRAEPRKTVEAVTAVITESRTRFNRAIVNGQRKPWLFPEQSRIAYLSAGMAPMSETALLEHVPAWLVPGQRVFLHDGKRMQARGVAAVNGNEITFMAVDGSTWPAGTALYPALKGWLSAETQTGLLMKEKLDVGLRVDVEPGSELPEIEGEPDDEFEGREVFMLEPLRFEPWEISHNQFREAVDYGYGVVRRFHPVDYSVRIFRARYPTIKRETQDRIEHLFARMKGMRGDFYMPTFENDLPPSIESGSGSNTLRVAGLSVEQEFSGSKTHRAIAVFLPGGDVLFNRITGIAPDGGDSMLTVASNWPQTIPVTATVSWMPVWRFATDILETEWIFTPAPRPDLLASTVTAFQMLEDTEPDGEPE